MRDQLLNVAEGTPSPRAASSTARLGDKRLVQVRIADAQVGRRNLLASSSDDDLSPAALAARVVLAEVARRLVREGRWAGASLHED